VAISAIPTYGFEDRGAHRDSTTPAYLNDTLFLTLSQGS